MTICIKKLMNGFHVYSDDPEEHDIQHAFEEVEDTHSPDSGEADCFARLLWYLNDIIGPSSSRYAEKRLKISVERGDKYEAPDTGINIDKEGLACPFCGEHSCYFENEKIDEVTVTCGHCGASGPYVWVKNNDLTGAYKSALEIWNSREEEQVSTTEEPTIGSDLAA